MAIDIKCVLCKESMFVSVFSSEHNSLLLPPLRLDNELLEYQLKA